MSPHEAIKTLIPSKYIEIEELVVAYLRERDALLKQDIIVCGNGSIKSNAEKLAELRTEFLQNRAELELDIRALQRLSGGVK